MWIPLTLVAFILGVVILRKYNIKMPAIAVSMPPVSGRVIAWVVGGIVVLVAAVWLYSKVSFSDLGGVDVNLWIAIGILLIMAVRGIMIGVSKWAGIAALTVVVVGLLLFGADAPKVWKKVMKGASSVVLDEGESPRGNQSSAGLSEGESSAEVVEKPADQALPPLPADVEWVAKTVEWGSKNLDGTIPIYAQSVPVHIEKHCSIKHADGQDIQFKVLRLKMDGNWDVQPKKDRYGATDVKYMMIVSGVDEVLYWVSCPQ